MKFRRILTIIPLFLYWVAIFIIDHINIPKIVYRAQVSDKALHFIVYFILAFLLWFSISPDKKVNWRKPRVWWVLVIVVVYGIADELLQTFVQRTCDARDFAADFAGAVCALAVCTFMAFWPALLVTLGVTIFGIANVAKADLSKLVPLADSLFYFVGFASFTAVWIKVADIHVFKKYPCEKLFQTAAAFIIPAVFLVIVKLSSHFLGRHPAMSELVIAFCGIAMVTVIYGVYLAFSGRCKD